MLCRQDRESDMITDFCCGRAMSRANRIAISFGWEDVCIIRKPFHYTCSSWLQLLQQQFCLWIHLCKSGCILQMLKSVHEMLRGTVAYARLIYYQVYEDHGKIMLVWVTREVYWGTCSMQYEWSYCKCPSVVFLTCMPKAGIIRGMNANSVLKFWPNTHS